MVRCQYCSDGYRGEGAVTLVIYGSMGSEGTTPALIRIQTWTAAKGGGDEPYDEEDALKVWHEKLKENVMRNQLNFQLKEMGRTDEEKERGFIAMFDAERIQV